MQRLSSGRSVNATQPAVKANSSYLHPLRADMEHLSESEMVFGTINWSDKSSSYKMYSLNAPNMLDSVHNCRLYRDRKGRLPPPRIVDER